MNLINHEHFPSSLTKMSTQYHQYTDGTAQFKLETCERITCMYFATSVEYFFKILHVCSTLIAVITTSNSNLHHTSIQGQWNACIYYA